MKKISIIYIDKNGNTKKKENIEIISNSIVNTTLLQKKLNKNIKHIIKVIEN